MKPPLQLHACLYNCESKSVARPSPFVE